MDKPFIYLFKTRNSQYFFDVNTSSIVYVTESIFNDLLNNNLTSTDIQNLYQKGYLKPLDEECITIEHPVTRDVSSYLERGMKQLILQLTQNCNLRCKYCVYSGSYVNRVHSNKRMTYEIAKKAVDFYYNHSQDEVTARIGMYGGEPLLEFDLIEKITDYAEKLFWGKELRINITTNATLLDRKIINFMQDHNVDLTISLDGPKEVQDKDRVFADGKRGTFDVIMAKIELIKKEFPDFLEKISFNAVISRENDFICSSNFFTYDFLKSAMITSTTVSDRDAIEDIGLHEMFNINYEYELFKSFISYIG